MNEDEDWIMKNINKQILKSMLLSCFLLIGSYQKILAAESAQPHIYPVTNQMVNAVKNAPSATAALDVLCGQGGVMRGSGWNAGNTCKLQDFARVAVMTCQGYVKGKDAFANSKCDQNINKVLGAHGRNTAKTFIEDSVKQKYPNVTTFVCDTTPGYRDKLPEGLKLIAANFCTKPAVAAPAQSAGVPLRPTAKLPVSAAQSSGTVTTRSRANAISPSRRLATPLAKAIAEQAPPIEFNVIIQSALRDLSPRQSMMVNDLFEGQKYLLGALENLEKKYQQLELKGVSKIDPVRGELAHQENALIDNYENAQTTLIEIKTAIEVAKPIAPELYQQAQKLSVAIKDLTAILDKTGVETSRSGG